jgi:hypothetical protein
MTAPEKTPEASSATVFDTAIDNLGRFEGNRGKRELETLFAAAKCDVVSALSDRGRLHLAREIDAARLGFWRRALTSFAIYPTEYAEKDRVEADAEYHEFICRLAERIEDAAIGVIDSTDKSS